MPVHLTEGTAKDAKHAKTKFCPICECRIQSHPFAYFASFAVVQKQERTPTSRSRPSSITITRMPTILEKIVATKREEIAAAKTARPESELRAALPDAPPVRDFFAPLAGGPPIRLIAEVKKASPSKGLIRADFDPVAIARSYAAAGASCISCLTDESYFQGHLEYLTAIRESVGIPVLRKDFLIDSYQLLEARVAGADAVLLIAECLDDCNLRKLHNEALSLIHI